MRSTRLADNYFAHKVLYFVARARHQERQMNMDSQIFHPISTTRTIEYHCTRTARAGRNTLTDSTPLIEAQYIIYMMN